MTVGDGAGTGSHSTDVGGAAAAETARMRAGTAPVGRQREVEILGRFLAEAAVGGGALLLTGPVGIGRTALLDEAVARAASDGVPVARARGVDEEADLPYAGLHQLLAPLDALVPGLAPPHRATLRTVLDGRAAPDGGTPHPAVAAALRAAAGTGPLLVAVDDLHRMDAASAACLRRLPGALAGSRVGLLLTAATAAGTAVPELRLAPLPPDAAAALVADRAPGLTPQERDRVVREADGNPLVLCELARRPAGPLGPRLAALHGDRVAALPADGRRVLVLAALADTGDLDVLLGVGAPVPDGLLRAQEAGLVRVADRRVRFVHPAVRATATALATADERRQAHVMLAAALAGWPDRHLRHVAEAAAGPDEAVARALEEHAGHALDAGDAAGAVAALRRAADLTPPGPDRAGRRDRAAYVSAAVHGALDGRAVGLGADSLWGAATRGHVLLHGDGDLDSAHRVLVDALAAAGPAADPGALDAALDTLLATCRIADRPALWAPARALAARHAARLPADRRDPVAAVRAAWSLLAADRTEPCRPTLRRLLDDGPVGCAVEAAVVLALDAVAGGRWDEAGPLAARAAALGAPHGHRTLAMLARLAPALVAACRGDDAAVELHLDHLCGWATPRGARLVHHGAAHVRVLAALGRGEHETAYHRAAAVTPPGVVEPEGHGRYLVLDLVEAAVRTGRHDEAAAHVRAARDAGLAAVSARAALVVTGAVALVERGERARASFEEALAVPGAQAWPFDVARVRLAYGEQLRRARATLLARHQLTAALTAFRALDAAPWVARTESELRAAGHRTVRARSGGPTVLSHQERTVADLAATGATNRQIGERLGLSPRTVGSHLSRAFHKLGVTSRAALGEALGAPARS